MRRYNTGSRPHVQGSRRALRVCHSARKLTGGGGLVLVRKQFDRFALPVWIDRRAEREQGFFRPGAMTKVWIVLLLYCGGVMDELPLLDWRCSIAGACAGSSAGSGCRIRRRSGGSSGVRERPWYRCCGEWCGRKARLSTAPLTIAGYILSTQRDISEPIPPGSHHATSLAYPHRCSSGLSFGRADPAPVHEDRNRSSGGFAAFRFSQGDDVPSFTASSCHLSRSDQRRRWIARQR